MYSGPIIDSFLHTPWLGGEDPANPRGDRVDWNDDPRLQRVLNTFHHTGSDGVHVHGMTGEEVVAKMKAVGVEKAILPAKIYYSVPAMSVRALHDELANLTEAFEDCFKWVCTLIPPELGPATYWDAMQNVRLVEEANTRSGLVGVHLTPSPWGTPPNHKWFYPVYAKCVELGLAVFTYVGMPGPLWPMHPNDPAHLDEVALAFPELKIVAHHIGDPWIDMVVRLASRHPNFHICTAAWHPKRYPAALVEFMKEKWHGTFGSEKVMFASDYPILDIEKTTAAARRLDLSEAQLSSFLYTNALRLFWPRA